MALSGLKVLDLSRILAGPWSTQVLADLGADVVKVESPDGGDDTRKWGPPFIQKADGESAEAAYFSACNRNKRSICIDFSTEEGAKLVRSLAMQADILVENYKLNGLKKYSLDYESIKEINPGIIYCSITGFGQTGPYAHRAGYDFLIQGMGGLMSITGQPDGSEGAEPVKVGVAVADLFTGMYASTSILAALNYRNTTGEGQYIDCSLLDSQVAMLANQASNWLNGNMQPTRMGNNHPNVVPYRVYEVSDGFVIISCGNDGQFKRLGAALGEPELGEDHRFSTNAARIENRSAIDTRLSDLLIKLSRSHVIEILEEARVPCGPINNLSDVFDDPHVIDRGLHVQLERSDGATISSPAFPAKLSLTPASYRSAPPALGADSNSILKDWLEVSD